METTKTCSKCKQVLPLDAFGKNRRNKSGLQHKCKRCDSIDQINYYKARREKMAKIGRVYQEASREKIAERKRAWYAENRENEAKRRRAYREANREKVLEIQRDWYTENREKVAKRRRENLAERSRAYRAANREKMAERKRARQEASREKKTEWSRAWYADNREKAREHSRKCIEKLSNSYVAGRIGISTKLAPPDLIEAKREQLKLVRLLKEKKQ